MSVDEAEIKCFEYINLIEHIQTLNTPGLYGLDNRRSKFHDEICELMGLSKEQTKKYTDNLDKFKNGTALYLALLDEKRKA